VSPSLGMDLFRRATREVRHFLTYTPRVTPHVVIQTALTRDLLRYS
jgi:hypothetical protein